MSIFRQIGLVNQSKPCAQIYLQKNRKLHKFATTNSNFEKSRLSDMHQERQTRQNSGGGGVGEVTQGSGPFFKGSTFQHFYAMRLKKVYTYAKRLNKTYF